MIIGHYAASFAAKAYRPDIPLWHLVLGAQLIDFAWSIFILVGIEEGQIIPNFIGELPFDFYYMPYSHSFPALLVWFGLSWYLYNRFVSSALSGAALVVAAVVASHWFLDLIVHPEDLMLQPGLKVGFGFWNFPVYSFILELGLLLVAFAWYAQKTRLRHDQSWHINALLGATMLGIHAFFHFDFYPRSIMTVSASVLIGYAVVTWLSWKLEQIFAR